MQAMKPFAEPEINELPKETEPAGQSDPSPDAVSSSILAEPATSASPAAAAEETGPAAAEEAAPGSDSVQQSEADAKTPPVDDAPDAAPRTMTPDGQESSTAAKAGSLTASTPSQATATVMQPEADPTANLLQIISFNAAKRNNIHLLDDDTLIMAVGSVVLLLHMPTMQQRYLPGRDGGGVAAVSVHPSRQYFLVAEKCRSRPPNIYIYQYPSLALVQTLPSGTDHAYSCAVFSTDGVMLAGVGSAPDYLLTLWEWKTGDTLLRCKAFSQEVYSVRFSPYTPGNLVTCGTGHIRFWTMATTFTGLKLQGQIGKFGSLELSDVAAFVEMPDGKVLSGSESGALLVWDGGLVKVIITRPAGAAAHDGPVEVLLHDTQTNYVLSSGGDGMLRLWDFNKLNDAEPADGSTSCEVRPAAEVPLPGSGCVRGVLWEKRSWLVQSDAGALFRVALPINLLDSKGFVATKVLDLHSGAVLGAFTCPDRHVVMTAAGGTIRAISYRPNQVLQQRHFSSRASCMAMLPVSVDAAQRTAVLGFADGCVRLVRRCSDGWRLLAAVKPLKAPVTCAAVSPDGSRLAAVGADGRVFFFQLSAGSSLTPQLVCQLPGSNPSCSCWSPDGSCLLVGFSTGVAVELAVPVPGSIDTRRTFEHEVSSRTYVAKLPRQQPKAVQQQQQDKVQEQVQEQQEQQSTASTSTDTASRENLSLADSTQAAAPVQQLAAEESEAEDPFQEQPVLPVTWLTYKGDSNSRFLLWLGGQGAGLVLECSWDQALPVSSFTAIAGAAVTAVNSSWSGRYALLGSVDGVVRVEGRQVSSGQSDGRQWQCALHGMHDGHVSALAMAHDDSCLITAASDGTLMLLANPLDPAVTPPAAEAGPEGQLPTMAHDAAASGGQQDAPDLPPGAQSLEEAKQAAQLNQQAEAAAAAREQLVAAIEAMRREHAALVAENEARPPGERLPSHMLELDAGLEALVERERSERLADARAQVAYEAELAQLRLNKLQHYFTANLAVHHVTLHSLSGSSTVSTFRQAELPSELLLGIAEAEKEEAEQQLLRQQLSRPATLAAEAAGQGAHKASTQRHDLAGPGESSSPGLPGPGASCVMSRADLWRQAKKQRAAEWAAFNASRPDGSYEAPADVAALAEAAATIGDFKLKSEPGYVLPEDQRLTPARKRRQMLLLMRDMAAAQTSFNNQVLRLRDEKRSVLVRLNAIRERLSAINKLLGIKDLLPALAMLDEEEPEQQLTAATDAQIAAHMATKKAAAEKAAGAAAPGGLGGFAAAGGKGGAAAKAGAADGGKKAAAGDSQGAKAQSLAPGSQTDVTQQRSKAHGPDSAGDAPAAVLSQAEQRQLQVERQQLLDDMSALQSAFDASLAAWRGHHLKLAISLKSAEGQLLLMTQELAVLKDAEVRELVLEGKRSLKAEEQAELAGRLSEVGRALDAKRAEGDSAAARRAAVVGELEVLLADQDAFREQLTKMFHRKIKRTRKHAGGDDDDADGSDASESDGSGCDDSGDEDDDEVCPPGCDPSLYEGVVELRERRLDEEEAAGEVGKALEGIKKERELLAKKAKLLEQALAAINQSVLEFQQEKQARLNALPSIVSLRLHQVEYLEDRRLPDDLSGALVFSHHQLAHLKQRMQELDDERSALRHQQKELRRQHGQLQADRAAKEARLAELTDKCRDVQLLKFGQVIDVGLLDTIGVRNKGADELREQLKQQARAGTRELDEWDDKIAAKRRELLCSSRENTAALNTVTDLTRTQRDLEAAVLAGRSALWHDPLDSRRAALAERDKLVANINSQAGELDALRCKIAALKRKDSSVYS